MELTLIKRVCIINGVLDVSFIPYSNSDHYKAAKIKRNRPLTADIKKMPRKHETLRWMFTIIDYFSDENNLPEHLEKDLKCKGPEYIKNWLKYEVGYCESYRKSGTDEIFLIPYPLNFHDMPDENFVKENFIIPAQKYIADAMGYKTVNELFDAVISYAEHKTRVK